MSFLIGNRVVLAVGSVLFVALAVVLTRASLRACLRGRASAISAAVVASFTVGFLYLALSGHAPQPGPRSFNWIPLSTFGEGANSRRDWLEIVANVWLFVPLGSFGAVLLRRAALVLLVLVVGSGVVELAQFIQHQGRSAEVDDIILNSLGTGLGLVAHRLWLRPPGRGIRTT